MLRRKSAWVLTLAAIVALGFVGQAVSQDNGGADKGGDKGGDRKGGDRGGDRKGGGTDWRQQFADRLKADLGVNDEELKALLPKIDKVQALSRDSRANPMTGRGGPGGSTRGGDTNQPQSQAQQRYADLQKVIENKDASAAEIKTALTAYRDARNKAREELQKAQKELQEILTIRQEAVLVRLGVLD